MKSLNRRGGFAVFVVVVKVRLVNEHDGLRAAATDDREIPLHAAQAEIRTSLRHDHDDVHICRNHLLLGALSRSLARETSLARQTCTNHDLAADIERNPVAHGRQIRIGRRIVVHLAAHHDL